MKTTINQILLSVCLVFILCMSTECDPNSENESLVSTKISVQGGIIEHPRGFSLEFPEGAFDESVDVSIKLTELPQALPNEIELKSEVFEVNTSGINPKICATLSFILSDDNLTAEEGELGIYRWDGEEWTFAGGTIDGNLITTKMANFSAFIVGTGKSLHKKFRFRNTGENNAMVFIEKYVLDHPDLDAPITEDFGTPCFTLAYEPFGGNLGWYPQGCYKFCADWIDNLRGDSVYNRRHIFIGGDTTKEYIYQVHENTSLDVPPNVYVPATYTGSEIGPCPARYGSPQSGNAIIPTSGLIAEFTFSGNPHDGGSNAYSASVIGAELTTDRFGNSNSAYYFSGSDYIYYPDFLQPENVTLIAWFKTSHNYSEASGLILNSASASGFFVTKGTNTLNAFLETGYDDYNQNRTSEAVNDNSWHMAAISYSGSQVIAYLDGEVYSSSADEGALDYDMDGMWIGRFWYSDQDFFVGSIDDIRVYNRALSTSEINSLYNE